MQIVMTPIEKLKNYDKNARTHSQAQIVEIINSIKNYGFLDPIEIGTDNVVISGHARLAAALQLGLTQVPTVTHSHLDKSARKGYILATNRIAQSAGWDASLLKDELTDLKNDDFDLALTGFTDDEIMGYLKEDEPEPLCDEDDCPDTAEETTTRIGDVWLLGGHRVMCGDATQITDINKVIKSQLVDLVFTDPPYGMGKEIINDNLNLEDLLEFNRQWVPLSFAALKPNGSWYCWGIDEPLMDIYTALVKPLIAEQKATFRNLITWDKHTGQGQNSKDLRSYAIADEKCLFIMCGVQGFNNNADNYSEIWEPIRAYLDEERKKCGWSLKQVADMFGFHPRMAGHWFTKSQWTMPTKEQYERLQKEASPDTLKREYQSFRTEYEVLKREFEGTRAYFDNIHDNFNNVWHFARHVKDGTEGGHATPKPIALCERAILSSSREGEVVLDLFGGSGSTLIACEKNKRRCYTMELSEKYCDVIIKRWQKFTGKEAILESTREGFNNGGKAKRKESIC